MEKALDGAQHDILERYEFWKSVAMVSGPMGIAANKAFKDHPLKGNLKGLRSSRLKDKWKVIYRVVNDRLLIEALEISPDDYRRI